MKVEQVRDEATLKDWHGVSSVCWDHDHVALPADPVEERLPALDPDAPHAGERHEFLIGLVDGCLVAIAEINLPTLDNLQSASIGVQVLPERRQQGHGAAMLDAALSHAEGAGRSRFFFEVPSAYPSGDPAAGPLLTAVGARPVLKEVRRLADLRDRGPLSARAPAGSWKVKPVGRLLRSVTSTSPAPDTPLRSVSRLPTIPRAIGTGRSS